MKSKQEILNSYYTQGADGLPEISAADLLNAMEAYSLQNIENAFNAARKLKKMQAVAPQYEFPSFKDYIKSTEPALADQEKDDLHQNIVLVADSILPNFLPDNPAAKTLTFNFTMQGTGYTASYIKDAEGYWQLNNWQLAANK